MKVFLSTINFDHLQRGMIDAFTSAFGAENVRHFDYLELQRKGVPSLDINAKFHCELATFGPDWAFLQLQNTEVIHPVTLSIAMKSLPKCVFTHWMGDARPNVSEYLTAISGVLHVTFLAPIGHKEMYEKAGAKRVHYMQIGLDEQEDILGIPDWTPPFDVPEVVFVGNHYGSCFPGTPKREAAVLALLDAGINIGVVGDGWKHGRFPSLGVCTVKQQHHVWKRAKVGISVNNFNGLEGHYSDRHLACMAVGTPLVTERIPGLEKEFNDGEHLLVFDTMEDLVAKVKILLADDALRQKIGEAGKKLVIENHTWTSRIKSVLPIIEEIRGSL